jgi:hypothetical protein
MILQQHIVTCDYVLMSDSCCVTCCMHGVWGSGAVWDVSQLAHAVWAVGSMCAAEAAARDRGVCRCLSYCSILGSNPDGPILQWPSFVE